MLQYKVQVEEADGLLSIQYADHLLDKGGVIATCVLEYVLTVCNQ